MTHEHFDHIAGQYDSSLPPHIVAHYLRKRTKFILEHCSPGDTLDVGCGTGVLGTALTDLGYRIVGVDPSHGMLGMLERASDMGTAVASGVYLPFSDNTFDLTYCVAVIHHIAEPEAVRRTIAEMVRVTRSGGHVLIWDHNPNNPYWPILMRKVPQDTGDERLVPIDELLSALRNAGATPLQVRQLGLMPDFVPAWLVGPTALVERVVETMPLVRRLCAHNVVLCQKH